eukprot:gene1354-1955_t
MYYMLRFAGIAKAGIAKKVAPVFYVHGGGFTFCNSEILTHSLTPLARAEDITADFNVEVQELLLEMEHATGERVSGWQFPLVDRVASMYGILDTVSTTTGSIINYGANFAIRMYRPLDPHIFGGRMNILDLPPEALRQFPETLIQCGSSDPFVKSAETARELLQGLGVKLQFELYPGTHAFFGMPVAWVSQLYPRSAPSWRTNSAPSTKTLIKFLQGVEIEFEEELPLDPSIYLALLAVPVIPILTAPVVLVLLLGSVFR